MDEAQYTLYILKSNYKYCVVEIKKKCNFNHFGVNTVLQPDEKSGQNSQFVLYVIFWHILEIHFK